MAEATITTLPYLPLQNVERDGLQCRCVWAYNSTQTTFSSSCPTKGNLQTSVLPLELTDLRLSLTSVSLGSPRG